MNKNQGNIKIYIMDDYEQMSIQAAAIVAEQINRKPDSVIGFATGSTPVGMYKELIKLNKAGKLSFSGIIAFNLDEYFPIKKSNAQSYDYFMKDNLFNHVNIDKSKLNIPDGEATDAQAECIAYEGKIKASGGIDLQILGMGNNGHIGFNEPADAFTNMTNCITLDKSTIEANARFFQSVNEVPIKALTMGIKTIMLARKIVLLVNGEKKAKILKDSLLGNITPKVPASALQLHQNVVAVVDKEAGKYLG